MVTGDIAVTEDTAVAKVPLSLHAKTVCNTLRNTGPVIIIDRWIFFRLGNDMLNIKVVTWSLAIWTAFTFVFCVVYGLVTPASMHMTALLEQVLPGFKWLTLSGFLIGLIESFLYGAYAGLVYVPIYNFMHRKWVRQ